jgi:hypothetical protein
MVRAIQRASARLIGQRKTASIENKFEGAAIWAKKNAARLNLAALFGLAIQEGPLWRFRIAIVRCAAFAGAWWRCGVLGFEGCECGVCHGVVTPIGFVSSNQWGSSVAA